MFEQLNKINKRPAVYELASTKQLWTDEYIAGQMLNYHLNPDVDMASKNHKFIKQATDWISKQFCLGAGVKVCDLGCGPGLYTSLLAQSGAQITGVDFSENSIDYACKRAREKNLNINYVLSDYMEFEPEEKFDLVTMIFWDFCALSPAQRSMLLTKCQKLLKDDGSMLMDFLSVKHYENITESAVYEFFPENGFWSSAPNYVFTNIMKYDEDKVVLMKYTVLEENKTRESLHWLKCYTPEVLTQEFASAGFCVCQTFANVAGAAYDAEATEFAVIAKKA